MLSQFCFFNFVCINSVFPFSLRALNRCMVGTVRGLHKQYPWQSHVFGHLVEPSNRNFDELHISFNGQRTWLGRLLSDAFNYLFGSFWFPLEVSP